MRVSLVGNFQEITACFFKIGLKNTQTQKSMKQQKSTLFDKLIPFFVQATKVFKEEKFQ